MLLKPQLSCVIFYSKGLYFVEEDASYISNDSWRRYIDSSLIEVRSRDQPMKGRHLDDASRWLVDLRRRKGRILEWKASRDYRLLEANLRGLLQRVFEGHFQPSTTSIEANDWSHRMRTSTFRSRTCLRFAQPRGDRSISIDQSGASGYTIVLKSAERHAGSQRSPSAWKKSVSGLPD